MTFNAAKAKRYIRKPTMNIIDSKAIVPEG
jgi:hypothetical protein